MIQEKKPQEKALWQYRSTAKSIKKSKYKKQATENWITDRRQEIDSGIRTGHSMAVFDTPKLLTQRQQTKTKLIENTTGKILTEEKAIHKQWTEYCTELHNYKLTRASQQWREIDDHTYCARSAFTQLGL